MNIDDLLTSLLKLKNQGCKEVTIDIEQSKVYNKYGYLNIRDGQGDIIQKIRKENVR